MNETIHDLTAKANDGKEFSFAALSGKPLLIVNTASKCGFTPQYKGLETIYNTYRDRGLVVVAFPCDQFGHQEPGTDSEIAEFCERNFGVTFPLMSKIEVTHPVFAWLKKKASGVAGAAIKWNFTKFLVSKDGSTVKRYAPNTDPESLASDIERELARANPAST